MICISSYQHCYLQIILLQYQYIGDVSKNGTSKKVVSVHLYLKYCICIFLYNVQGVSQKIAYFKENDTENIVKVKIWDIGGGDQDNLVSVTTVSIVLSSVYLLVVRNYMCCILVVVQWSLYYPNSLGPECV